MVPQACVVRPKRELDDFRPLLVRAVLFFVSPNTYGVRSTVRRANRCILSTLAASLLVSGLQACAVPADGVTGTSNSGTAGPLTRFESSIGAVKLGSIGASQIITVTGRDRSGRAVPGVSVDWTSSDATIADVSSSGTTAVVTARAPGRATVRARTGDLLLEIDVGVSVVRNITIAPQVVSVINGGQLPLNVTVDADAGALRDLRWLSDNPSIASVSWQGVITGVAPGSTTIRVNAVGDVRVTATAQVTVTSSGTIELTPATLSMGAGERRTLAASVNLEPGLSTGLIWRSENNAVATVSSTGVVTGVSVGSTIITAVSVADSTRRRTADVSIVPVVRDIDITPAAATIFKGDTRQIGVSFTADPGASRSVFWRTSDADVAAVSSEGIVRGVSAGTAIVTAISAADTTKRATSLLTVRNIVTVNVSPTTTSVDVGATRTLVANVTSDNGSNTAVTWRTSNSAVATVSTAGVVTGVAVGTVDVIAVSVADTTQRATSTITVTPVVRSVSVTPGSSSLRTTQSVQLVPTVVADAPLSTAVRYRSANSAIATVNATGLVTGVAIGSTSIVVMSVADTTKRATSLVTVSNAVSMSLSPTAATVSIGATRAILAIVSTENGSSTAITWRTSNPAVVTISADGVVTGVAAGTADVFAVSVADTLQRVSSTITVVAAVRSVAVTPASSWLKAGQTLQLVPTVVADAPLSTAVSYRSANSAVATVSAAGVVTAIADGSTSITVVSVADTTKRASMLLSVGNAIAVSVSPTVATVGVGASRAIVATVTSKNGSSTAVTWQSSNPSIVVVSADGVVTGVAIGTADVTAISVSDITQRATSTVTVAAAVRSLTVSPGATSLLPGQSVQLVPTVIADAPLSTAVSYRSANNAVATVSATGLVTAVADGSTSVVVTSIADTTWRSTVLVSVSSGLASTWAATRLGGALYEDVVSLHSIDANNAFAVNLLGDVFRWNGSTWSVAARGALYGTQFLAVHGASAGSVMAVGTNGVTLYFDGSIWTIKNSGTTNRLNSVFLESASSGFAVGANGTALRWNGSSWSVSSTGSSRTLNSVWASGGGAFAVGSNGEVLRFVNGSWSRQSVPTTESLSGVSGTSSANVVAVGSFGTVLSFNGTVWSTVNNNGIVADLYAVSAVSATDPRRYIASDDGLLLLSNGSLSRVTTPYTPRMFSVAIDAAGSVWAGGQRGSVQRLTGGNWNTLGLAPDLIDAWTTSASNAWAVGEFGFIYRWNGATWARQAAPTTATLNAVWGASSTDAFAGGDNGTMLRFNGSSWTTMSFPSTASVYGLWGSSATNVFAVTAAGEVVRFNGATWAVVTTTGNALWAIHGTSPTDIVATGENGAALRFTGSTWSAITVSTTGTLAGVWSSGTGAFSVGAATAGNSGVSFSFSGTSWSSFTTGSSRVLTSIWGPHASDLYATGEQGTLLRFNGTSWSVLPTGTSDLLWSVTGAPSGNGGAFAVGYNSTVVAGTNATSFSTAMVRGMSVTRGINLNPSAGARRVRGPMPSGKLRKSHRQR